MLITFLRILQTTNNVRKACEIKMDQKCLGLPILIMNPEQKNSIKSCHDKALNNKI